MKYAIGNVQLKYGDAPEAEFSSEPRLYSGDKQMVIASAEDTHQEQTIESNLLGIKRAVEECASLAQAAAKLPQSSNTLALLDGSLILWGLAGREYPEFVIKTLLDEEMLGYLDKMRKLDINNNFGLASYISYPRGNDVLNSLRIEACPHTVADTDKYCASCESRECDVLSGIQDRDLFDSLLISGQRSALFKSRSKIIQRYGPHKVYFFYLKLEEEIARVELPEWSAINPGKLNLIHTLLIEQCKKGQGYPVALSEAHEQAVVTGTDRESFWQLVESELYDKKMTSSVSAKSRSKQTRGI